MPLNPTNQIPNRLVYTLLYMKGRTYADGYYHLQLHLILLGRTPYYTLRQWRVSYAN